MSEEYDMAVLSALDRLVARYGPRPVTRLAELIRHPQRAEELAAALESAAASATEGKVRTKAQRADRVGMAVLNELRLTDPEKHSAIAEIRRQLISRTTLPSMGELRRFARMHDLSIGKASSRNAAIAPFIRSLSQLPMSEILLLRDSIIQSRFDDRSLDNWRDVIVGRGASNSDVPDTTR